MAVRLETIKAFTAQKHIAIAGVSRNPKKFGNYVYKELKGKGYEVYAINPHLEEYEGGPCYRSIAELPADVTAIHVCTPPEQSAAVVQAAHERGIGHIWVQQGATHADATSYAEKHGLSMVDGKCIMMFADPVSSVHKFHRTLVRLFGRFPK